MSKSVTERELRELEALATPPRDASTTRPWTGQVVIDADLAARMVREIKELRREVRRLHEQVSGIQRLFPTPE